MNRRSSAHLQARQHEHGEANRSNGAMLREPVQIISSKSQYNLELA